MKSAIGHFTIKRLIIQDKERMKADKTGQFCVWTGQQSTCQSAFALDARQLCCGPKI